MASTILITGGAGFVGHRLAEALLEQDPTVNLLLTDVVEPRPVPNDKSNRARCVKADLSSPETVADLLSTKFSAAYILHGIMSSGSEADLELGYRVNLDSVRLVLDHFRKTQPGLKVVFTSSTAVYGPPESPDQVYSESTLPCPQSSYGTQKYISEALLNDYSRRGLLDGRVVRLPTITVRAGAPTAAASSFASGILREPLQGQRAELPVRKDLKLWVCSPQTVVKNLVFAKDLPKEKFGLSRVVNLPGQTVSVQEMLDALEEVGGKKARDLVEDKVDPATEKIVESWPFLFKTDLAKSLGYEEDMTLSENIRLFKESLGKQ